MGGGGWSILWRIGLFCREVCIEVLQKESTQIGGPGEVVEIDESRGCVGFGGIDRTRECFFGASEEQVYRYNTHH